MNIVRWLSPTKAAQKRKKAVFRLKFNFIWRKFAMKFLCVNTVSDKIGLSIRAKIVRGERPLLRENLAEADQSPSKKPISNQYSLVTP